MLVVMVFAIWKWKIISEDVVVEEKSEKQPIEIVENREFESWKPQYQSKTKSK